MNKNINVINAYIPRNTARTDKEIKDSKALQHMKDVIDKNREELTSPLQLMNQHIFKNNRDIPSYMNVDELQDQLNDLSNAIDQGKDIYGIDTETLGSLDKSEASMFIPTEISVLKTNKNKGTDTVFNMALGIGARDEEKLSNLLVKAKNQGINTLTGAEISTLERSSRYAGKFEQIFKKEKGVYTVNGLAESNILDFQAIESGINNLRKLGLQGQAYGSKAVSEKLNKLKTVLQTATTDNVLTSYNGKRFDMPVINEVFKKHNINYKVDTKNNVDIFELLKASTNGDIVSYVTQIAKDKGVKVPKNELSRLQTLAKVFDKKLNAHMADADTEFMLNLLSENITDGNVKKSMFQFMADHLNEKLAKNIGIDPKHFVNKTLYANRADFSKPFDLVTDKTTGKLKNYMSVTMKRHHFYNVDSFDYITKENLVKNKAVVNSGVKLSEGSKGLYVMKLSDTANIVNAESIYKISENIKDFQSMLQDSVSVFKITKEDTLKPGEITQKRINANVLDAVHSVGIRNASSSLEGDGAHDYSYIESLYKQHSLLNEDIRNKAESIGLDDYQLSKKQLHSLLMDKELVINNGEKNVKLQSSEIFTIINQSTSPDKLATFESLYSTMNESSSTMNKLFNSINESIKLNNTRNVIEDGKKEYLETKKSIALNNAIKSLQSSITEGTISELQNEKDAEVKKLENSLIPITDDNINDRKVHEHNEKVKHDIDDLGIEFRTKAMLLRSNNNSKIIKARTEHDLNTVEIMLENKESKLIDVSSSKNASNSFMRHANSVAIGMKKGPIQEQVKVKELLGLVNTFNKNDIISNEAAKALSNINNAYEIATTLGNTIYNKMEKVRSKYSLDKLLNIDQVILDKKTDIEMSAFQKVLDNHHGPINLVDLKAARDIQIQKDLGSSEDYNDLLTFKKLIPNEISITDVTNKLDQGISKYEISDVAINHAGTSAANKVQDINLFSYSGNQERDSKEFGGEIRNLLDKHGYSEENIKTWQKVMNGSKNSGLTYKGLGMAFFEQDDKLKLAIFENKNTNTFMKKIMQGDDLTKVSAVLNLHDIRTDKGVRLVKIGDMEKGISKSLDIYSPGSTENGLRLSIVDTIDQSIKGITKVHKNILQAIKEKRFEQIAQQIQHNIDQPIMKGMGFVGYDNATEKTADGVVHTFKELMPTLSDRNINNLIDMSKVMNLIPFLYDNLDLKVPEELAIKKDIDKVFKKYDNNRDAIPFMEDWKNDFANKKLKDNFSPDQKLYVKMNMFDSKKLFSKIHKYKDRLDEDGEAVIDTLFHKDLSMMVKNDHAEKFIVSEGNPLKNTLFSFLNGLSRPVMFQNLAGRMHNEVKVSKNWEKKFKTKSGSTIISGNYLDTLRSMREKNGTDKPDFGITTNLRRLDSDQMIDRLEAFDNKDVMNEVVAELVKGKKGEDIEDIRMRVSDIIDAANFNTSTHEQHGLINPELYKKYYNDKQLKVQRLGSHGEEVVLDKKIKIGATVLPNSFIGRTTDDRTITYDGHTSGTITDIRNNRIYVEPKEKSVEAIKGIFAGNEKGIFSMLTPDLVGDTKSAVSNIDITQSIWNRIAGDFKNGKFENNGAGIGLIADFELAKHGSGEAVLTSPLYKILDTAQDNNELDNVLNLINNKDVKKFGDQNITDEERTGLNELQKLGFSNNTEFNKVIGNIEEDTKIDFKQGIKALSSVMSKHDSLYKDILADEDVQRGHFVEGRKSDTYSSMAGIEDTTGKGVKLNNTFLQTAGISVGDNPTETYEMVNGEYKPKLNVFFDDVVKKARLNENNKNTFNKANSDIGNILNSAKAINGNKTDAVIKNVSFNDLKLAPSGINASELEDTIFSKMAKDDEGNTVNMFKIELPEKIKITNPLNNKLEDHIYIPKLNTYAVDGKVYLNGVQKDVADLLTTISNINSGMSDKTLPQLNKQLNDRYSGLMSTYMSELTDKKGIAEKYISSVRVPYSSNALAESITPAIFKTKDMYDLVEKQVPIEGVKYRIQGAEKLQFKNKIATNGVMETKNGETKFFDVVFTSKKQFEDMGVNFAGIGDQLFNEHNVGKDGKDILFRGSDVVKKRLLDEGVISEKDGVLGLNMEVPEDVNPKYKTTMDISKHNIDPKYYERMESKFDRIGQVYTEEEGVRGVLTRYPTFKQDSTVAALFKLTDSKNLNKNSSFYMQSFTAIKLNADSDGDIPVAILSLSERAHSKDISSIPVNGILPSVNSLSDKALKDVYEAAGTKNHRYVYEAAVAFNESRNVKGKNVVANKYSNSIEDFMKYNIEADGKDYGINQNMFSRDGAKEGATSAKLYKSSIGWISAPNYTLRDTALSVFSKDTASLRQLQDVLNFTDLTEQKLMDKKHVKTSELSEIELTPTGFYNRAFKSIAKGDTEEGMNSLIHSLSLAGLIDKDLLSSYKAKDIISGKTIDTELQKQLHAVADVFKTNEGQIAFSNIYRKAAYKEQKVAALKSILNNADNIPHTPIIDAMISHAHEAMDYSEDKVVIDINKASHSIKDHLSFISNDAKRYKYSSMMNSEVTGMEVARFYTGSKRNDTFNEILIHGSNNKNLMDNINKAFDIMPDKTTEDTSKIYNTIHDKKQANIIKESNSSYKNYVQNKIIADTLKDGHVENTDELHITIKTKLMNTGNAFNETQLNDISDTLVKKSVAYSKSEDAPTFFKELHDNFFNNSEHPNINVSQIKENTLLSVEQLQNNNQINEDMGGKIIEQMNNSIIASGKDHVNSRSSNEILGNAIEKTIKQSNPNFIIPNKQVFVNKLVDTTKSSGKAFEPINDPNIGDLIAKASSIKMYDKEGSGDLLYRNMEESYSKIVPQLDDTVDGIKLMSNFYTEMVDKPLKEIEEINDKSMVDKAELYEKLANSHDVKAMQFLNWNDVDKTIDTTQLIESTGKAKIGFGHLAGVNIENVKMNDLINLHNFVQTEGSNSYKVAVANTKRRVDDYLSALDKSKITEEQLNNIAIKQTNNLSNAIMVERDKLDYLSGMNEDILERSRKLNETKEEAGESIISRVKHMEPTTRSAVLGGIAIGLVASLMALQYSNSPRNFMPEKKNNGSGSPSVDGSYDGVSVNRRIAPSSPQTARLEPIKTNGVKYNIRGNSNGTDHNMVSNAISSVLKNFNVAKINTNSTDNRNDISDNWIEQKVNSLINNK